VAEAIWRADVAVILVAGDGESRRDRKGRGGAVPTVTGNERLARAVLLFFRDGPWTDDDRAVWETMTGYPTPTAATLCEFAREVLSDERMRSQEIRRSPPPAPEEPR